MYGTGTTALLVGLAAASAPPPAVDYRFGLSSRTPGTATGMTLEVTYGTPGTKPPRLARVAFELPPGLRLDTGAMPQCTANNEAITLLGERACPAATRIGQGTLTAITGIPGIDPFRGDTVVFNGKDELIEVVRSAAPASRSPRTGSSSRTAGSSRTRRLRPAALPTVARPCNR